MPEHRAYETQTHCPVARTLDVVGDRWTILVLRDLSWGRCRFSALLESLEGISANLLSDRLKRLEGRGMVERVFYSDHPPRAEYRLTGKGKAFVPILIAMREYGDAYEPAPPAAAKVAGDSAHSAGGWMALGSGGGG